MGAVRYIHIHPLSFTSLTHSLILCLRFFFTLNACPYYIPFFWNGIGACSSPPLFSPFCLFLLLLAHSFCSFFHVWLCVSVSVCVSVYASSAGSFLCFVCWRTHWRRQTTKNFFSYLFISPFVHFHNVYHPTIALINIKKTCPDRPSTRYRHTHTQTKRKTFCVLFSFSSCCTTMTGVGQRNETNQPSQRTTNPSLQMQVTHPLTNDRLLN